jgi:hypothetical protein
MIIVFNATFKNISVISWWSVLLVEETGEIHRPVASDWQILSWQKLQCIVTWNLLLRIEYFYMENCSNF